MVDVQFGVPQGSVLGSVSFNPYVNDLSDSLGEVKCHQYANETTFYVHGKPSDITDCQERLSEALSRLSLWSKECNLSLNPTKTKTMLFSTPQMARVHHLDDLQLNFAVDGHALERVTRTKLLGTEMQQNLKWEVDVNAKIASCYSTLSILRKLKSIAPFNVRKQLAECLILSKLDYNITVTYPVPEYLIKRLQRVQLAAGGFVYNRFVELSDIVRLGWLPIKERQDFLLSKLAFKALHSPHWPQHLKLEYYIPTRTLRSASQYKLEITHTRDTFQYSASKVFNSLPLCTRSYLDLHQFNRGAKKYFAADAANSL